LAISANGFESDDHFVRTWVPDLEKGQDRLDRELDALLRRPESPHIADKAILPALLR
jgi:hypothetical protein